MRKFMTPWGQVREEDGDLLLGDDVVEEMGPEEDSVFYIVLMSSSGYVARWIDENDKKQEVRYAQRKRALERARSGWGA